MHDDNTVVTNRSDSSKSILKWLIPLLLLLLLGIGLLYYFLLYDKDETMNSTQSNNATSTETEDTATQSTNTSITNLSALLDPSDPSSVIGSQVNLSSAVVDKVIGDKSFTLGASDDYVYALLSDDLDTGQTEQAVQVKAGETRSVVGKVVKAPSDSAELISKFQLTQLQADELKKQGFYIDVEQTYPADPMSDAPTGAGTE